MSRFERGNNQRPQLEANALRNGAIITLTTAALLFGAGRVVNYAIDSLTADSPNIQTDKVVPLNHAQWTRDQRPAPVTR